MVHKDDKKKRELRSHIGIFYFQEADQVQSGSYIHSSGHQLW